MLNLIISLLSVCHARSFTVYNKNLLSPHIFVTNLHNHRDIKNYKTYTINYNSNVLKDFTAYFVYNSDIKLFGISPIIYEKWWYNDSSLFCKMSTNYGNGELKLFNDDSRIQIVINIDSNVNINIKNKIIDIIQNTCKIAIEN